MAGLFLYVQSRVEKKIRLIRQIRGQKRNLWKFVAIRGNSCKRKTKEKNGYASRCYGRQELASLYFPFITPSAAWRKLRSLMGEDTRLHRLSLIRRRTFTPIEVERIFGVLGCPL